MTNFGNLRIESTSYSYRDVLTVSASTPHPEASRLEAYHAGRLPASEGLAVSDHLVDCPACRAALAKDAGRIENGLPGTDLPFMLADAPPDYTEMAALLDGTLNEAQSLEVRAGLAASPEAAAEFADLQRFRDQSVSLPPKLHGPGRSAAIGTETLLEPGKIILFPRRRRTTFAALSAAAALVLLSAGWWLISSKSPPASRQLWADADLSGLPDDLHRSVEQAARTGTIEASPLLAALRPDPGTLAGSTPAPSTFQQTSPVGMVVRENRPTLRWTQRDAATSYVVYLVDTTGQTPMLRQEVPGNRTDWTPAVPLAPTTVYEWQVEARRGSEIIDRAPRPPAPETRFEVLDEQQAAELGRVEARYQQYPLVLGTAYARMGLTDAAFQQFAALQRQYPQSTVARQLLQQSQDRNETRK